MGADTERLIEKSIAEFPDFPLVDRKKLFRELETIRAEHLAFDPGEHGRGISAVGVATLDASGRPFAVSIPAPTHRFEARRGALVGALSRFRSKMLTMVGR